MESSRSEFASEFRIGMLDPDVERNHKVSEALLNAMNLLGLQTSELYHFDNAAKLLRSIQSKTVFSLISIVVAEENVAIVNILKKAGVSVAILGICASGNADSSCEKHVRECFPVTVLESACADVFLLALRSLFKDCQQDDITCGRSYSFNVHIKI